MFSKSQNTKNTSEMSGTGSDTEGGAHAEGESENFDDDDKVKKDPIVKGLENTFKDLNNLIEKRAGAQVKFLKKIKNNAIKKAETNKSGY